MTIYLIAACIVVYVVYNVACKKVIVYDYEKGLLYKKGKFVKVLGAGLYRILKMTTIVKKIDTRIKFITIPGQELLSSEGIALKVSLAVQYEIADPELALIKVEDYQGALYLTIQLALREIISAMPIEEILQKRGELAQKLSELSKEKAKAIGVNLINVSSKDIMFPGELKNIFAQEVKARKEGLAVLEKTRGETAALRNLANAAKVVQDNPVLLQLRMLQSTGNTFVMGFPGPVVPLKKEENLDGK